MATSSGVGRAPGPALPLKMSVWLHFEDSNVEQTFNKFYAAQTLSTACAASAMVILGGSTLCVKAAQHNWEHWKMILLLDVPIVLLAVVVLLLMRYNFNLFERLKFCIYSIFKVYGSTQANYICAALLPMKITSTPSFVSHMTVLSPMVGQAFYTIGYFLPFRFSLWLHVLATALTFWCVNVFCHVAVAQPAAPELILWLHNSVNTMADLIWCGLRLPGRPADPPPITACRNLMNLLAMVAGFAWINANLYLSELKARVKYACTALNRPGVLLWGRVVTQQAAQGYTSYLTIGLLYFCGISWYTICFLSG